MDPSDARDQRIAELEAEVARLRALLAEALARIAELEERLRCNSRTPCPERHEVVEWPLVKPLVTDYIIHTGGCRCGAMTRAELPMGVPTRG